MRTDPRQDSFSFVNQGNIEMTDTVDTSDKIVQTQQVRDIAVSYGLLRKMPKATIEKYRSGAGDSDPLVVLIATAVKAGESNIMRDVDDQTNRIKQLTIENANISGELNTATSTHVGMVTNLARKLTEARTAILDARIRNDGSFWGKTAAVHKILYGVNIYDDN